MDTFSVFSTAPSMGAAGAFNVGHPFDSTSPMPSPITQMSALEPSAAAAGVRHPSVPTSTAARPTQVHHFSTAATHTPLAGQPFNVSTLHFSTAIETDTFDGDHILSQTLSVLQDIAEGRHLVDWAAMLDVENPIASAEKIGAMLAKASATGRREGYTVLARSITSTRHLAIVSALEEQYRNEVRDRVLQELLRQLTNAGSDPMPLCAEMLAELSRLNLVRLSGVAAAVEQFLMEPNQRRAGFAVLGRVAEQTKGSEAFYRAIQSTKNKQVETLLRDLYKEPQYEYDVVAITQLLGGEAAERNGVVLQHHTTLAQPAPVACLQYFRSRDELVSAHGNGSIVMWGGPNAQGDVAPHCTVDLPLNGIPTAMAGSQRGQYLAVASMPCPESHPYAPYLEVRRQCQKPLGSKNAPTVPCLCVLECSDPSGNWASGEVMPRPAETAITAVAALGNSIVCSAESTPTATGVEYAIQLFNATNGQMVRSLSNVHNAHTTVLATCEDNELVLCSGSKDGCVKLWDTRINRAAAAATAGGGATPLFMLDTSAIKDTITCIYPFRSLIFTGALDGSMFIWDTRRMAAPVATRTFTSPVLDITTMERSQVAVATARGLFLVALEPMLAVDVLPNAAYTQLRSNEAGTALFAAGSKGISIFSLKS